MNLHINLQQGQQHQWDQQGLGDQHHLWDHYLPVLPWHQVDHQHPKKRDMCR